MKVWIDQDLCTGDGLCEEIAPDVFALLDDGLAYVKDGDKILSDPAGAEAVAPIPEGQLEATIESAEECPGECIYIEVDCRPRSVSPSDERPPDRPSIFLTAPIQKLAVRGRGPSTWPCGPSPPGGGTALWPARRRPPIPHP